jgi:hypothetical protein
MRYFALLLFGVWFLQTPSFAQDTDGFRSEFTQVKLRTDSGTISSGTPFKVFLDFDLAEGWHTYADPPGDSGLPVRIAWTLPPDFKAGGIEWPPAETYEDFGFTTYGYSGKVSLPITITPPKNTPSGTVMLKAKVDWMVCEKTCIPESAELSLSLPVATQSAGPEKQADAFCSGLQKILQAADYLFENQLGGEHHIPHGREGAKASPFALMLDDQKSYMSLIMMEPVSDMELMSHSVVWRTDNAEEQAKLLQAGQEALAGECTSLLNLTELVVDGDKSYQSARSHYLLSEPVIHLSKESASGEDAVILKVFIRPGI